MEIKKVKYEKEGQGIKSVTVKMTEEEAVYLIALTGLITDTDKMRLMNIPLEELHKRLDVYYPLVAAIEGHYPDGWGTHPAVRPEAKNMRVVPMARKLHDKLREWGVLPTMPNDLGAAYSERMTRPHPLTEDDEKLLRGLLNKKPTQGGE